MGVVGRAHGVRGLVRVQSHADDPDTLAALPLRDDSGRVWRLSWRAEGLAVLRDASGRTIADRTEAERLTNMRLYVDRDQLPPPAEDEFYLADLIGLQAVDIDGRPCGQVVQVHDYGAGVSLEIERADTAPLLVPFTRACVPDVDLAGRQVVVAPPAEREAPGP